MKLPVAAFLAFALSAGLVQAEPVRQGDLEIDAAWARASIGTSRPGAAYFTVRNLGDEADRLTGLPPMPTGSRPLRQLDASITTMMTTMTMTTAAMMTMTTSDPTSAASIFGPVSL